MNEKKKVLIIDDDAALVEATTNFLETQNFQVIQSKTGMEGAQRVRLDKPDLVVLDLMMETHDAGFLVAKELKGDPTTRSIPILLVSSVKDRTNFSFDFTRDRHWMKTDAFLEKPFTPEALLEQVNILLENQSNQEA